MKIVNGELIIEEPLRQGVKISAHNFVDLLGLNPYAKRGDTLLVMFGFVKKDFDNKWLLRGNFAEKIVKYVYERDGHKCVTYDAKEIKYTCFPDSANYSGIIDIELPSEHTLIEVKSKSEKDYDKIVKEQPQWEIYQGLFYGYLRNYLEITMEWIFFDAQTEQEIFQGLKPSTLKHLKRLSKQYKVNQDDMFLKIYKAYSIVKDFEKNKRIKLSDISDDVLEKLGLQRDNILNGLPF